MLIIAKKHNETLTPCMQTIVDFCLEHHVKEVRALGDEGKYTFNPLIQELPNWKWAWLNLPGAKFPGRFTIEPTYPYTWPPQTKPVGYHLGTHPTERTLFVLETPWVQTFDLYGEIIPTELIEWLLNASDLPHYEAGYGAGEGEDYSDIPGTSRTAFIDGTIPEEWVCVEELGDMDGCGDGSMYVRMPEEFYPFLDPKDFPSLSLVK